MFLSNGATEKSKQTRVFWIRLIDSSCGGRSQVWFLFFPTRYQAAGKISAEAELTLTSTSLHHAESAELWETFSLTETLPVDLKSDVFVFLGVWHQFLSSSQEADRKHGQRIHSREAERTAGLPGLHYPESPGLHLSDRQEVPRPEQLLCKLHRSDQNKPTCFKVLQTSNKQQIHSEAGCCSVCCCFYFYL